MKTQLILALLVIFSACAELPDFDFDAIDTQVVVTTFPPANLSALYSSSSDSATTAQNIQSAIANAQSTNLTPVRSIDSIFSRLPSTNELDQIILSADSLAILKTIQTLVSNDSIPCSQIVAYLLEMLGRMRAAIQKKQFAADQLMIIIDSARAEIARLQAELQRLEDERKELWLDEFRDQLREYVAQLEPLYKQFNEVESQIAPNEARVAGFHK